jgi:5-methylthioadenosine/S-adenosylhomocysteine deaminase
MRVALGLIVIEFPTPYASDAADYLRKGLALRDREGDDPLASFCLAPHAPYTVSDASFRQVAKLAAELDLPVHVHLNETAEEVRRSLAEHGVRPIERMRRLGLLGPGLIAVHAVHLEKQEIELLGAHAASVAHCPSSNLKLASGFAPVEALRRAGANVCLGTDGAASNNRLDVMQEMRTAALLAKAVAQDAEALPAHAALRAATLGGAQALGIDAQVGSLLPGKQADLTVLSLADTSFIPWEDPVTGAVLGGSPRGVIATLVSGKPQFEKGGKTWLELIDAARSARGRLLQDADPRS